MTTVFAEEEPPQFQDDEDEEGEIISWFMTRGVIIGWFMTRGVIIGWFMTRGVIIVL